MIKFFRSIRKRLLNQNKLGKYLIYAGGEILLVVIGILIALQVNNWQQEKRNSIKEHDVLEQLKAGFESNDRLIKSGIERYQWGLCKKSSFAPFKSLLIFTNMFFEYFYCSLR